LAGWPSPRGEFPTADGNKIHFPALPTIAHRCPPNRRLRPKFRQQIDKGNVFARCPRYSTTLTSSLLHCTALHHPHLLLCLVVELVGQPSEVVSNILQGPLHIVLLFNVQCSAVHIVLLHNCSAVQCTWHMGMLICWHCPAAAAGLGRGSPGG
jgi:hypothetical protein